jgi:hypothetical protein
VRTQCEDKSFARVVLLDLLKAHQPNQWNGIVEHEPQLADLIWRSFGDLDSLQFFVQLVEQNGTIKTEEFTYTRSGVTKREQVVIPRPAPEWMAARTRAEA